MANHDGTIISYVIRIFDLKDGMNDVKSQGRKKTRENNFVKKMQEDGGKGVDGILEEFSLKIFNIHSLLWI